MIYYDSSGNHLRTVLRLRGSVAPRALAFAVPCGLLGAALCILKDYNTELFEEVFPPESHQVGTFIAFNSILGFLIVFRTQNAYSRYWEGATLLQKVRGSWFNCVSHLFAFSSPHSEKALEVAKGQLMVVKLMSLLYCKSLQSVAMTANTNFEVVDTEGLDIDQLKYLTNSHDPPAVVMHWMQRLVVKLMREGVLDVPPAVLSRVFQELSCGVACLHDATKISDMPFPFAFAQMISVMLLIQFALAPIICAALTDSIVLAVAGSFLAVFLSCGMNLIASEIELPFGDDPNDLPLGEMQQSMNVSLLTLIHWRTQLTPELTGKRMPGLRLALYEDCIVAGVGDEGDDSSSVLATRAAGKMLAGGTAETADQLAVSQNSSNRSLQEKTSTGRARARAPKGAYNRSGSDAGPILAAATSSVMRVTSSRAAFSSASSKQSVMKQKRLDRINGFGNPALLASEKTFSLGDKLLDPEAGDSGVLPSILAEEQVAQLALESKQVIQGTVEKSPKVKFDSGGELTKQRLPLAAEYLQESGEEQSPSFGPPPSQKFNLGHGRNRLATESL